MKSKVARSLQPLGALLWFTQRLLYGRRFSEADIDERFRSPHPSRSIYMADLRDTARLYFADSAELRTILARGARPEVMRTGDSFVHFNGIRAALILGDLDAAYELLRHRISSGQASFIDDVQWTRFHLLTGDPASARDCMQRARLRAARHRALPRLEFELRLARELSLEDFAGALLGDDERRLPDRPAPGSPASQQAAGPLGALVGVGPTIRHLRNRIAAYAPADQSVLVLGPTGSGKDLVARLLHEMHDPERPFVAMNCASLGDTLLEAELFGHRAGAYTGATGTRAGLIASAASGTLFLDEIGDTSSRFQLALLRLLETGDYRPLGSDRSQQADCRIIAATNRDLLAAIEAGDFREDLFYRLRQLTIEVPPLAERREDIPILIDHFIDEAAASTRRPRLTGELIEHLTRQDWPGNVRQLRNEIRRILLIHPSAATIDLGMYRSMHDEETAAFKRRRQPDATPARSSPTGVPSPTPTDRSLGGGNPQMRRRSRIIALFREHRELTRKQIAASTGLSDSTVTRYLKGLVHDGTVEKVCPTPAPATHYFILREPEAER